MIVIDCKTPQYGTLALTVIGQTDFYHSLLWSRAAAEAETVVIAFRPSIRLGLPFGAHWLAG